MQKRWTWLLLILIALVAFAGCSDDDDPTTPESTKSAFDEMVDVGSAYINNSDDCPGVINAKDLNNDLASYTVIDIRAAEDFTKGHIPGAFNSSLGTLLDDLASKAIPTGKPYVLACYSGQSAGHAKIAMELMEYDDVYSLLFGMSSWSPETSDPWNNNTADKLVNPEKAGNNDDLMENEFPVLEGDASTIVATQVAAMLDDGFKGVMYDAIKDNLQDYFIVNYFGEADYLGDGEAGVPGHIPGAFQFTPYASMGKDQMLMNLPTDQTIVVYCWTGQHSSQVTAYLNMAGYDAVSLAYGSNNLFHTDLTAHKWTAAQINDFELEEGSAANEAFTTMANAGAAYLNDSGDCPGVINAKDLNNDLDSFTVIDIRAAEDYAAGHIPGAYLSSLGTLLDDLAGKAIPNDKPYVLACYSGQSAGHAKIAMELMGYDDVYSLLFGMSSWSPSTSAPWDGNIDDTLTNPEMAGNNDDLTQHGYPVLTEDPASVVATRVTKMLAAGFKGVMYDAIKDNLQDYFILNYFGEDDYLGNGTSGVPGHIPGAFQFTPYSSMGIDEMLENIPTDETVVVYCWTGQHSSQVTAYLNMLGYDAVSLKYGSNNLFHTNLTAHKWSAAQINDFDLEVGAPPTAAFSTMAAAGAAYINDSADCPGVINAKDLNNDLASFTVIDIRAQIDFDAGHIDGAHRSSLGTLLADLESTIPTDKPYVIACYSGQSAGHAKIAMELMGYEDVYSLLFGMSSWSPQTSAPWDGNIDDTLTNPESVPNNPELVMNAYPVLPGDEATVVEDRVNAMLAAGFQGVMYDAIKDNLQDYFIINYFGEADYLGAGDAGVPGHIPGAFQFTPYASMGIDQMLANIPADKTVVVYCWTGQHSSQVTAYLNMLGYDALSLKYGSNNLFHTPLTAHKWSAAQINDFTLVGTKELVAAY